MDDPWNAQPIRTVGELRKALEGIPDEMPVLATWEGIYRLFASEGISDVRLYRQAPSKALVFDVEYHWPD